MNALEPCTLAEITGETLWSLGKLIEHDPDLQETAPVFCSWLHAALVAEHIRRQTHPDAAPAVLSIPADWTAADLADALCGSTALSYAGDQDLATSKLLDSITLGIAVMAANHLRLLAGRVN